MRLPHSFVLPAALGVAALGLVAGSCPLESGSLESVPNHGACDVVIQPGNQATTLALLDDPTKRVFCVAPGDYRGAGELLLTASGTPAARRFLRYHAPNPLPVAVHHPARAVFEAIRLQGSWWVIQGITVQPRDPATNWFLALQGGDRNVIDGNLIDGSEQLNSGSQTGIVFATRQSDPATYNSVQRNVVRSGNRSRLPLDYAGIALSISIYAGGNNDFNKVVDNEIYDWGDGVALTAGSTCDYVGRPRGTLIQGNDIYITAAKRADCATGMQDPDGDCSCAENGIDIKIDPGTNTSQWTRIIGNRLWGFRPTPDVSCGGSGSNGQAITAGNSCAGHVFVAGNVVSDAATGISPRGPKWTIVGNFFHAIRVPPTASVGSGFAILTSSGGSGFEVQFNTVLDVDNAYDDGASSTDTRCNAILRSENVNGMGGPRGSSHQTRYNFLYDAPLGSFIGSTNQVFANVQQSGNEDFCFWRKLWTGMEFLCLPFGHTTSTSPHQALVSSCEANLGSPFGFAPLGYF